MGKRSLPVPILAGVDLHGQASTLAHGTKRRKQVGGRANAKARRARNLKPPCLCGIRQKQPAKEARMSSKRIGKQSKDEFYQSGLLAAMSRYLPRNGLATLPGNCLQRWTARLLVVAAILMAWDPGPTLADRFDSVRSCLVKAFGTQRRPGKTYAGFIDALAKVSDTL